MPEPSKPLPNRCGLHYGYTALFPVEGEQGGGPLRVHLNGLDAHEHGSPFSGSTIIHLLRFIVIDRLPFEGYPAREDGLGAPYLVVMCDFDGEDVTDLARSLAKQAPEAVCDVFSHCQAFPFKAPGELAGEDAAEKLAGYLRRGQVETALYLSDQPDARVGDILRGIQLQMAFATFVADSQTVPPGFLKHKFFEFWRLLSEAKQPLPGSL
jgi:hypothetical protein